MNAGLSNLSTLRQFVLGNSLQSDTRFDNQLLAIGLGLAGVFDAHLNRKLAWQSGETIIFSGDRPDYYLPRAPLANVSKVEMRYFIADAWTDITGQPIAWNPETGLLSFGYTLGTMPLQVRTTWSGGYWFETLEPDDAAYPSTIPAEISAAEIESRKFLLPDSLKMAWLLQCQQVWDARDKLGLGLADKPGNQSALDKLELSPLVKQMLQPWVRYQLT